SSGRGMKRRTMKKRSFDRCDPSPRLSAAAGAQRWHLHLFPPGSDRSLDFWQESRMRRRLQAAIVPVPIKDPQYFLKRKHSFSIRKAREFQMLLQISVAVLIGTVVVTILH